MASREDTTITDFCERLAVLETQVVRVVGRPDKDNPGQPGCDAIILRDSEKWALEHTTIDSFRNQREDDVKFEQVVVPLEKNIPKVFPDSYFNISIPVHVIPKGVDWNELAIKLEAGCIETIRNTPIRPDGIMRSYNLTYIPFSVRISREPSHRSPQCHVMRVCPPHQKEELVQNMISTLKKKDAQLQPYKERGLPTILLIESDDPSLVNADSLADALSQAMAQYFPAHIDQIYIAEADRNPMWYYPVKLVTAVHPHIPEYEQYWHKQYRLHYGTV